MSLPWGNFRKFKRLSLAVITACVLTLTSAQLALSEGFSAAKLMEKLDQTERQLVTSEVKSRIPGLFSNETDQKIASTMIAGFDSLAEGKINDAISTVLSSTADIYDFKGILFRRFPDNTHAGAFLRKADQYPAISKKLARGLLNKRTDWNSLSKDLICQ